MILLLAVGLARAGDCPADSDDAISQALAAAGAVELSYADVDEAGFVTAYESLQTMIGCVRTELTLSDAITLHRAMAIGAFVDGAPDQSRKSWGAIRALQPEWSPSDSLMPVGHPLREIWLSSGDLEPGGKYLEKSPPGGWGIDSARGVKDAPISRAYLLQGFDTSGTIVHTGYYYEPAIPVIEGIELIDSKRAKIGFDPKRRRKVRLWGTVGAGVMAAAAGVCFGLGADSYAKMQDATAPEDITSAQVKTNTLSGVGVGLSAAAVGTGVLVWTVTW